MAQIMAELVAEPFFYCRIPKVYARVSAMLFETFGDRKVADSWADVFLLGFLYDPRSLRKTYSLTCNYNVDTAGQKGRETWRERGKGKTSRRRNADQALDQAG